MTKEWEIKVERDRERWLSLYLSVSLDESGACKHQRHQRKENHSLIQTHTEEASRDGIYFRTTQSLSLSDPSSEAWGHIICGHLRCQLSWALTLKTPSRNVKQTSKKKKNPNNLQHVNTRSGVWAVTIATIRYKKGCVDINPVPSLYSRISHTVWPIRFQSSKK